MTNYKGFTISGSYMVWRIFKDGKEPFASRLTGEIFDSEQACKNMIDSSLEMKAKTEALSKRNYARSFEKLKSIMSCEDQEQADRDRDEQRINDYWEQDLITQSERI